MGKSAFKGLLEAEEFFFKKSIQKFHCGVIMCLNYSLVIVHRANKRRSRPERGFHDEVETLEPMNIEKS